MSHPILKDLQNGQSSVDAIRLRLGVHGDIIAAELLRYKVDGLVEDRFINHLITVYRLTPKGHQLLADLATAP